MGRTTTSLATSGTERTATMAFSTVNKVGFVLAILLALLDVVAILQPTPEGEVGPPLAVLALGSLLGVITLVAVGFGWARHSRRAIRAAAATRIISAILALPAFFAPDVPAPLVALASVFVLVTIVAVTLMLIPARRNGLPD
jgi:hypothetical protein